MDLNRIWRRNLERDDRVVSNFGREFRIPFLDEDLVNFVLFDLNKSKVDASEENKFLLREAVRNEMGLNITASREKK